MTNFRDAKGARPFPGRSYTSSETFRAEVRHLFRQHWLCVGHASEFPEIGSYRVTRVGGESLILVRTATREYLGHYNVCRHRGTLLCEKDAGTFPNAVRCPYHGWTYGLDGQLLAAPNMRNVAGFRRHDYPLRQVSLGTWNELLFVNFVHDPQPLAEYLGPLQSTGDRWQLDRLTLVERLSYKVQANWKLLFQNFSECYHCPHIHPLLSCHTPFKSATNNLEQGPILGGPMELTDGSESLTGDGRRCAEPLVEASDVASRQVYFFSIFPGLLLSLHPDYVLVHRIEPEEVDGTRVTCDFLFHSDAPRQAGFQPQRAVELWDVTNREDWHVCELAQRGVSSAAYTPGPYAHLESICAAWDAHYLRAMESAHE